LEITKVTLSTKLTTYLRLIAFVYQIPQLLDITLKDCVTCLTPSFVWY